MKMSTKSKAGDYEYTLVPEGIHDAVIVAVVDLGTQPQPANTKFADAGPKRKVYLVWELVEESTRPIVGKDFTASLNEKATYRKWIEKLGKKFREDEELDSAALAVQLAGKKCQVTIEHTKGEKKYNVVTMMVPAKNKQAINDPEHKPFTYDIDRDGLPFRGPDWLPYWYGRSIEEVIADCQESKGAPDKELMGDDEDRDPVKEPEAKEIPF